MNELYAAAVINPLKLFGAVLVIIDEYIIGGIVRLTGKAVSGLGNAAVRLQNGQVQTYSVAAVIGLIVLIAAIVGRRLLP
ncbi:NADH:ubiquinone oxidoreductase subunit L [compost metagenome]